MKATRLLARNGSAWQLAGLTVVLCATVLEASADSTIYTNEPGFLGAIGVSQQYLNNFDDLVEQWQYAHPLNYFSNGFRYSFTSQPIFEIWSLIGAVSVVQTNDEIVLSITNNNVRALGGWLYLTDSFGAQTNGTVRVALSDGTTASLGVGGSPPPAFTGFVSGGPVFTWMRLRSETPGTFPTLDHFYVAEGTPWLEIVSFPAGLSLSWPAPSTGYVLQSTTNLVGAVWMDVSYTPQKTNAFWQTILPAPEPGLFFRLVRK